MKCRKGYKLQICQSAAGYYIGTKDEGMPNCRITEYDKTRKDVEKTLNCIENSDILRNLLLRDCLENNFCNGGLGCFK